MTKNKIKEIINIVILLPSITMLILFCIVFFINNIFTLPFYYHKRYNNDKVKNMFKLWFSNTIDVMKDKLTG